MRERRTTYRENESLEAVNVSVAVDSSGYVKARLIDLSVRGASLEIPVPAENRTDLPAEAPINLRFEIDGIDPISDIRAVVRNERQTDVKRVIGVEIIDWKALQALLPSWLFSKFNRRRHYRVTVPASDEIDVSVVVVESGRALTASLADISVGGGQLLFRSGDIPEVGDTVHVKFSLPGSDSESDLTASVKACWESEGTQRCGIEFQDMGSSTSRTQELKISRYVMERQRQLRR